MGQFFPSGFNLPLAWSADFVSSWLLKLFNNIEDVVIQPEDISLLRSFRRKRLIFFINHKLSTEFLITYKIANKMGARFCYPVPQNVFDEIFDLFGKALQNLGAFPFATNFFNPDTLNSIYSALAHPSGKLLLCPEGEPATGENDFLRNFNSEIIELAFNGLKSVRMSNYEADIIVVPIFLKYVLSGSDAKIKSDLHLSLRKIERIYNINPGNKNMLRRVLIIARIILEENEQKYNLSTDTPLNLENRLKNLPHAILDQVAIKINVPGFSKESDIITKIKVISQLLEQKKLNHEEQTWVRGEIEKAHGFSIVNPDRLVAYPTAEQLNEWLTRFENYLPGSSVNRPCKVFVRLGKHRKISDHFTEYQQDKNTCINKFTTMLQAEMEQLSRDSLGLSHPIVRPLNVGDDL